MNSLKRSRFTTLLVFFLITPPCITCKILDAITPNQPIRDGDFLLSGEKSFALGFFSPGNSLNRYVGVWYHKIPKQTVVWVANRDNPIRDTSGVLSINRRRGLVLCRNNETTPMWSSNASSPLGINPMAKLLDVGNLVLLSDNTNQSSVVWQGFDYPTHTFLPNMKLGLDLKTGLDRFLTCWKSPEDPGIGNCSYRIDPTGYPQLISYMNQTPIFRTGSWTGVRWSGVPRMGNGTMFNATFVNKQDEISITYILSTNETIFTRLVIDESGILSRSTWLDQTESWAEFFRAPDNWCDNYAKCGANSNCDPSDSSEFECSCLLGFEPKSPESSDLMSHASGECVRRRGAKVCESGEGFVTVSRVKLPDTRNARVEAGLSMEACERRCLGDCNCTAYAAADELDDNVGCLMWRGDLLDTRIFSGDSGLDLYVRVDAATLAEHKKGSKRYIKKTSGKLALSLGSIAVFSAMILSACLLVRRKIRETESKRLFYSSSNCLQELKLDKSSKDPDIPLFDLNTIAVATGNFSADNKLGEGGFGPVYKGRLSDGREIAVKRLSKCSGQGNEEFRNEVILIAKLQHRNLVRILGCCFQKEEKMLIYEYLPNKSLDFFIFDETRSKMLDWRTRFDIICGVARGMLYLHQDSRLRIIHRDLKASNVLLDAAMNPKISDFGLARIFGGDQIEARTKRVVGTYGYMSPEYAMEGVYSIKSDVYSFGVLLLEIITGRKKIDFYDKNPSTILVARIWDLWREGKVLETVDSSLHGSFAIEALMKCVQIGLLCVQENPSDRPTMSTVVSMLCNNNINDSALPSPKKPAFRFKNGHDNASGEASTSEGSNSINVVTCSVVEAR